MWRFGLLNDMKDESKLLFVDDRIAVIKDKFPKAEKHFLVLPQENISSLASVTTKDVELLKYMYNKGCEISEEHGPGRTFRIGYHAKPSLERLHLHVISDDFNSPSLKKKKHWYSFTTPMFMDSKKVIEDLETLGKIQFPSNEEIDSYLDSPLKCHKCRYVAKSLPQLKRHIVTHL